MHLDVRFFGNLREVVGARSIDYEAEEDATVGAVLEELTERYPDLDVLDDDGDLHPHVNVLQNGRSVVHDDGLETTLSDGDEVGVFPPVEGG